MTAAAGVLTLEFAGGPADLELGKAAAQWAERILHPPTRADKLGIKPGLVVRLEGEFDAAFRDELTAREVQMIEGRAKVDLLFYAATRAAELTRVAKLADGTETGWRIVDRLP